MGTHYSRYYPSYGCEFLLDTTDCEIESVFENDKYNFNIQTPTDYINIRIKQNPLFDKLFLERYDNLIADLVFLQDIELYKTYHSKPYHQMVFKYKCEHNKIPNIKKIHILLRPLMTKGGIFYYEIQFEAKISLCFDINEDADLIKSEGLDLIKSEGLDLTERLEELDLINQFNVAFDAGGVVS